MIDLAVCIVSYNTRSHLHRCLSSIYATRGELRVEVTVVDNASSDGSADMVAAHFPQVHLIRNHGNSGFAVATNQALRLITAKYALLLNPDITACDRALEELHGFMETHPTAGAASGKLSSSNGSFQWYYYRRDHGLLTWLVEVSNHMTWNVAPDFMRRFMYAQIEPNRVTQLDMLPGGCMIVRQEVLHDAGLLDEDFFLLHEDDEWCRRIRDAGWKLYYCPSADFVHRGGTSFEPWTNAQKAAQSLASRLLFLDKHYPRGLMLAARVALTVNFIAHTSAFLIARRLGVTKSNRTFSASDRLLWVSIVLRRRRRLRREAV